MQTFWKFLFVFSLAILAQVCHYQEKTAKKIQGNFKGFDVSHSQFQLDASIEEVLEFANGSSIAIPANCFVNAKGQPVKGKVNLSYREFHTLADVITCGIPMQYDSAGKSLTLETAGMFELRASQNGNPLQIAGDKHIRVNLASYRDGKFNHYFFKEKPEKQVAIFDFATPAIAQNLSKAFPGEWKLLESSLDPAENAQKKKKLDSLNRLLPPSPAEPLALNDHQPVLEFDVDPKEFPELAIYEGILWQLMSPDSRNPGYSREDEWIFQEKWTEIRLAKPLEESFAYQVQLRNNKKSFSGLVRPVFKGKSLENAKKLYEQKMEVYTNTMNQEKEKFEAIKEEKKLLSRTANFLRSFQVQQLGIYNVDIITKQDAPLAIRANFRLNGEEMKQLNVFLISGRTVIQYNSAKASGLSFDNFSFSTKYKNKIVALLPNDRIAVFTNKDFEQALQQMKENKSFTFDLQEVDEKIASVKALDQLISRI